VRERKKRVKEKERKRGKGRKKGRVRKRGWKVRVRKRGVEGEGEEGQAYPHTQIQPHLCQHPLNICLTLQVPS
jgi:hypothetical protein